jgi:2-methylcitrate dehydratase PrpD
VDIPKGDPENTLSRVELEDKARRLAEFRGGASPEEMRRVMDRVWTLDREPDVRNLLPGV